MCSGQNDGIDVSFGFLSVMKRFVPFPIFIDPEISIFSPVGVTEHLMVLPKKFMFDVNIIYW